MKRVMVVDDAAFMRLNLRMILEKNGYEVIAEADNGKDAVSAYVENKPDLVTMDITMPILDGIGAGKEIKALDGGAKIIMVSAMGRKDMVAEAIMSGASNFIVKPFDEQKVLEVVSKVTGI